MVDELVRHDVRDAVLCPGSRSAPLALALAEADRDGRLRLHVRLDERGAGYLALGLAKATGRPVPVVVTSGTAVANLHPAMVEASLSGVPVLALTADRPPELRGSGANQTIDQVGIFGPHARAVIELGVAGDPAAEHGHWRAAIGRAVLAATAPGTPGPVQVDLPFREPLVPAGEDDDAPPPGRADGRPWLSRTRVDADDARRSTTVVDLTRRVLVVAGAGARPVPELGGAPTVAEPGAPVPMRPVHPLALDVLRPEHVVVCGRPTLHRGVTRLLADPEIALTVLEQGAFPGIVDPVGAAADVGDSVLTGWAPDPGWTREAELADARARAIVAAELRRGPVTGLHVADAVVRALRSGDHLVVGASNPIRDVSLVGPTEPDVTVHANRGASGIDGTLSTAIGIALGSPGRTVALVGDLTFLHDLTALCAGPGEPRPRDLTIVVADDDGGGIFSLLEPGRERFTDVFERVFGTPHGVDLAAVCGALGVECMDLRAGGGADAGDDETTATTSRLVELLAGDEPAGLRVVRVATSREGLRALHERLRSGAEG